MKSKTVLVTVILSVSFISIIAMFWYQENQYLLPTPVPINYKYVYTGTPINLSEVTGLARKNDPKPVLLHFFNPDCPCSRFNMEHFRQIVKRYGGYFEIYAVMHTEEGLNAKKRFLSKYDLDIPVITDPGKKLATACGVYSTPQAAIIDATGRLYYRGNYNKSRYCTDVNSNFAQMAIDSLLAGKPSTVFVALATTAYGCQLSDKILNN